MATKVKKGVAEADLAALLAAELALGYYLEDGEKGMHFYRDRGFGTGTTGKTKVYNLLFINEVATLPVAVELALGVSEDDLEALCNANPAGKVIRCILPSWDRHGKAFYDVVFHDMA